MDSLEWLALNYDALTSHFSNFNAEIVHDVLVDLAPKICAREWNSEKDLLRYINGAIRHKNLNKLRMKARRPQAEEGSEYNVADSCADDPYAIDPSSVLHLRIEELDSDDRLLILLYMDSGCSYAEVVRKTGMAETTIRRNITRIMGYLRSVIERELMSE